LKKLSGFMPVTAFIVFLAIWEGAVRTGIVAGYLLPAPTHIIKTLVEILPSVMPQIGYTVTISITGFAAAFMLAAVIAVCMDIWKPVEKTLYPALVLSQTVPVIALAPLLALWFGYGALPKVLLIMSVCFFPVAVSLLSGFKSADEGMINLMRSMGAGRMRIFTYVKIPSALPSMFSGLKIAAAYCVTGALVSEWMGGDKGLGVYMIRVRRSFAYDKMFASIIIVVVLSIILVKVIDGIRRLSMPYKNNKE